MFLFFCFITKNQGVVIKDRERLWLRCRANVLLLEGRWFDSPGLDVEVTSGKILNPKLLLMCWPNKCKFKMCHMVDFLTLVY